MANPVPESESESAALTRRPSLPAAAPGLGRQLSFLDACSLIKSPYSCLVVDTYKRHIALSPMYLSRKRTGIERQLKTELLRFSERSHQCCSCVPEDVLDDPAKTGETHSLGLQGVPIAYDKVKLVGELADIYDDQGYIHLNIEADFVIFRPKTGQKLVGVVNKVAPSHLGCLVHGCFNASIPKPHHANGIWPGFAVSVGDSLKFEVVQLDADVAGVLCIRGRLDKSVQAAYGVDSEEPLEKNSEEQDDGKASKKKKKKKKQRDEECATEGTAEEAMNCEISVKNLHKGGMGNAEIILDGNKSKKRKQRTKEPNANTELDGRDANDYHSDNKAIKKKKRKLSEGDSEATDYAHELKRKKKKKSDLTV
ncbi:DNA-directed RNA polymerase I subunit RPA43 isoform X1 [Heptranchias perlo]|uniref:DNA-directed RNA polymerase I subunit RPA43 isoform X1 n=1 Tax=Heptranchias perlo TaxID=212740 RepID=UPI003559891B